MITVLAQTVNKYDINDNFYVEIERLFYELPLYLTNILIFNFIAKLGNETLDL